MAFKKGQSGNPKGKPKGAVTKPRLSDYMTEEEILAIVNKAKELALAGSEAMIKLITEQHFGKPIQPVEGSLQGELILKFDKTFNEKPSQDEHFYPGNPMYSAGD